MKNIFKSILVSSVLLGTLTSCLFIGDDDGTITIYGEPTTGLTYEKISHSEVKVTGIASEKDVVIIPDNTQIEGRIYNITKIGKNAFSNSTVLQQVKLGNNIVEVEDEAFYNSSVKYVNFNKGLKSIGNKSFAYCKIKGLKFPNSLQTLGEEAFRGNLITSLKITSGISSIGEKCFDLNRDLRYINVDEENRFYDSREESNTIIKTATNELIQASKYSTIATSVLKIHKFAFHALTYITKIEIPANVREIEPYAISGNPNLKEIIVDKYNHFFETRKDTSAVIRSGTNSLVVACNATTSIPNSVIEIESFAFSNTTAIEKITIEKNITNVGANAFYGWTHNQVILLEDGVDTSTWDPNWREGSSARVVKLSEV